jgi:hypothetical protein
MHRTAEVPLRLFGVWLPHGVCSEILSYMFFRPRVKSRSPMGSNSIEVEALVVKNDAQECIVDVNLAVVFDEA